MMTNDERATSDNKHEPTALEIISRLTSLTVIRNGVIIACYTDPFRPLWQKNMKDGEKHDQR